jgi:hypothetical protein
MSGRSRSEARAVFFARDLVALEEARTVPSAKTSHFFAKLAAQLFERDIRRFLEHGEDRRTMRLNPTRAAVAQRPGLGIALSRSRLRQRLPLAALTPNRSAAWRWVKP